jgi:hypothetical protein
MLAQGSYLMGEKKGYIRPAEVPRYSIRLYQIFMSIEVGHSVQGNDEVSLTEKASFARKRKMAAVISKVLPLLRSML